MVNPDFRNEKSDNSDEQDRQFGKGDFAPKNRIKLLLDGREGKWLAEKTGLSQSTISDIIKGRSPSVDRAIKVADALNADVAHVFGDQAERRLSVQLDDYDQQREPTVYLPEIDIGYSMGGGLALIEHADAKLISFPRDGIRSLIKGTFSDVFVARGEGDSMMPTLLDGDIVVVDTSQKTMSSQDRLWCFSYGELGMIKRLRTQPNGGLLILSDNPAVQPFTAYDGEVHIIGRVIWIGRKV